MMLNPKPNEKDTKNYYINIERYDWITDTKYPEKLFHNLRERTIAKWIKKYIRKSIILDAGCGTGLITRKIESDQIVALDINPWAIRKAKSHTINRVSYIEGDVENLPFASSSFDAVICTDNLEHLVNPDKALEEFFRVMKGGALLIGEVPNKNLIWRFRKHITTTCPTSEPFHNNYSKEELKQLLCKFNIIKIQRVLFDLELLFVAEKTP